MDIILFDHVDFNIHILCDIWYVCLHVSGKYFFFIKSVLLQLNA